MKSKLLKPIKKEIEKYTEEDYDNMLDDCYPDLTIAGIPYDTSYALKEVDPTAYRCGFNDFQEYETVYECSICEKNHEYEDHAQFCCQEEEEEEEEEEED